MLDPGGYIKNTHLLTFLKKMGRWESARTPGRPSKTPSSKTHVEPVLTSVRPPVTPTFPS